MPDSPASRAKNLTDALNGFTEALRSVRNRQRVLYALLAIIFILSGLTLKSRHDVCHSDNELRGGLLHVADQLEDFQVDNPSPRSAQLIVSLREDFALKECTFPWL